MQPLRLKGSDGRERIALGFNEDYKAALYQLSKLMVMSKPKMKWGNGKNGRRRVPIVKPRLVNIQSINGLSLAKQMKDTF